MDQINVGLVGLGGMGRVHFDCHNRSPKANIVALCDIEQDKLTGEWSNIGLNLGDTGEATEDLSQVARYTDYHDLINDPNVHAVDVCLPTHLHAQVTIDALHAGKHVLCEKPMGFDQGQCWAMEKAVAESGKQLMIAHCLRYWPQYVKAHEVIRSGAHGRVLSARFHRSGATPSWSHRGWMRRPEQSGGAILDMHIHDVDAALWWFGKPRCVHAAGVSIEGLPTAVDSTWKYEDGPIVHLHGSWDPNGGPFRYAFKVVMEQATIACDSQVDSAALKLFKGGETQTIEIPEVSAYEAEIDDFLDALLTNRKLTRVTPDDGRMAVEMAREELRQMGAHV